MNTRDVLQANMKSKQKSTQIALKNLNSVQNVSTLNNPLNVENQADLIKSLERAQAA